MEQESAAHISGMSNLRGKTTAASTPGSFAPHARSESEAVLDWVPGTPHPTGGYDRVEKLSARTEYTLNGKLHRLDGPALEWADGSKVWFVNDRRHRLDGPAIERADGEKEWRVKGKHHRLDGPAIEWPDGTKRWFIDGVELTEAEFEAQRTSQA